MELAKILSDGTIDLRYCDPKIGSIVTELRNTGFLDFVPSEQPQCDAGYIAKDTFTIIDGKVVQAWEIKPDPEAIQAQIDDLKKQLSDSDYKITKCYECSLVGEELPYNINELHSERQAIRDEINELESLLVQ